jgi:hypothetical protein
MNYGQLFQFVRFVISDNLNKGSKENNLGWMDVREVYVIENNDPT